MSPSHPAGLPYIVANEAAERFSYYGMKGILVVFMTTYLLGADGVPRTMTDVDASYWYHIFTMGNYAFPILGGLLADIYWGKFRTIFLLSLVYCAGHAALAVDSTRFGLALGLSLIAAGAGGIKPCVSAHLGDQYEGQDDPRIEKGFGLFYMAINVGAAIAIATIPVLLKNYGPDIAFAVPGLLMAVATIVFVAGRRTFRVVPPVGAREYFRRLALPDVRRSLVSLVMFFLLLSVFWSLFDQTGSSWVVQAGHLDTTIRLPWGSELTILPAQMQAANPLLVIMLVPAFTHVLYPYLQKRWAVSSEGKMAAGMVAAAAAFCVVAWTQVQVNSAWHPSILWQLLAYVLLTTGEVLVSVTSLEYAYTRAPAALKSLVMGLYFLSVSLGNGVTAIINGLVATSGSDTFGPSYFLIFASMSGAAAIALLCRTKGGLLKRGGVARLPPGAPEGRS